ncbi:MAB_1171c family putative transporter [Streptomyces sioyaensis]|uniref:MAB_1171c family putative transporter n=1 Tax=Streptomyces sioyaensis TaxID=67364 RepID=UPI0036592C73
MSNSSYIIPAVAAWIALICKVPALIRAPRDALLRAVCAVQFLGGASFFFAAPYIVGLVNRTAGTPNFAAPLVYGLMTALGASCLVLLVQWRGGPGATRIARRCAVGYSVVIVGLVVLFGLGDAPVERRTDLDTYYASTPCIREMILLYLLANIAANVTMVVLCWRWSTHVAKRSWLRRGLRVIALGFTLIIGFDLSKLTAVGVRWAGINWDGLSAVVAPQFSAIGAPVAAAGFVLPLIGDRLRTVWDWCSDLRDFLALHPLWKELRTATPGIVAPLSIPWWAIDLRLTRRIAEIHDGRLALRPYLDPHISDAAMSQARQAGMTEQRVEAVAEAAVLVAAARDKAASPPSTAVDNPATGAVPPLHRATLVRVSRALRRRSFVGTEMRTRTTSQEIRS